MNYILFDDPKLREHLKPFTFTRPIADLRVGILTMREKWEKHLGQTVHYLTENYLQKKYPLETGADNILINAAIYPNQEILEEILSLKSGEVLRKDAWVLALRMDAGRVQYPLSIQDFQDFRRPESLLIGLKNLTDIFSHNGEQIHEDFELITKGRNSAPITDAHTAVYHPDRIFLEEGVQLKACVLNAENGPIYLGKNAKIQEGSIVQGAFALCEGATINPGAKMRGDTTIGPYCKVGGEISNSVFWGYSNKGHEGFLGNSVIGEWCNLGADTNTSNLKNNYGFVKIWCYIQHDFIDTGRQFCGLMMGDHSKSGINTMFNTGTVVGVNANIFGGGFPPKFVPSFAWGGGDKFVHYDLHKAFEVAQKMMERRNKDFNEIEREILIEVNRRKSLFYLQREE